MRRPVGVVEGYLVSEQGNIDLCRARVQAGRIIAEIAPVGFHIGFVSIERLIDPGDALRDLVGHTAASLNVCHNKHLRK